MTNFPFKNSPVQYFHNHKVEERSDWPLALNDIMNPVAISTATTEIRQWPNYASTALHRLGGLAQKLEVAAVYYKDESTRFGLGSFKALGGAYAVLCLLQKELSKTMQREVTFDQIRSGGLKASAAKITVATATDGNHGRSVAWGAQLFGCQCIIYIHAEVSEGRKAAMEAFGATVTRVSGNYDVSVNDVANDAQDNGWFIVSDTSNPAYVDIPKNVVAGYAVFMEEVLESLEEENHSDSALTHVFLQGGVGGLASAVCGFLWQKLGKSRPRFIVVEPNRADCLYQSAVNGQPTLVNITQETVMAGLSCGEVSYLAWKILDACVDDFMTIADELVAPVMVQLADGLAGADPIVAGESAVAGLSALMAAEYRPELKRNLGLDANSRVLVIGTEGATDPDIYRRIVGRSASEVSL
jgi:diaminopropionate ammonia-lyase